MLQDGLTALHAAAANGEVEIIKLLVKHGAAVDIRDKVLNFILQIVHCTDCSTVSKMCILYNYSLAVLYYESKCHFFPIRILL